MGNVLMILEVINGNYKYIRTLYTYFYILQILIKFAYTNVEQLLGTG